MKLIEDNINIENVQFFKTDYTLFFHNIIELYIGIKYINPHCKRSKTHKHCLRLITLYFSNVEIQYLFLFNMVINCTSALHVELNPVLLIVFTLNSVNILKFGRTFEAVSDHSGSLHSCSPAQGNTIRAMPVVMNHLY